MGFPALPESGVESFRNGLVNGIKGLSRLFWLDPSAQLSWACRKSQ